MRYGYSLPERLQKFKELTSDDRNAITKYDVKTVTGTELHKVYHVSIELPKYRLDNTRTLYLQEQYVYKENKPEDFFSDVESDLVQEIQHNILTNLIKSSDKEKDLLSFFSSNEQTEPLILTHDGFVISGNRRLCAFRELINGEDGKNYEKYKHFSLVRVVILPNYDQDQIDQIEDFLEQQTDIKEPFSWISRAIGYRRRMQRFNYNHRELAQRSGQKEKEIESLIERLEIADRYLDSINKHKDYNQILDDDYAFKQIYLCRQKERVSNSNKIAFEKLAFLAIKNKEKFSDRMYKNIPIIQDAQHKIINELEYEFEEELLSIKSEVDQNNQLGEFNLFPDPVIPIIKLIEKPEYEKQVISIVSDKIEEHLAIEREKKKKSSVLEKIRKANTLLIEANQIKNNEMDKKGISDQLNNIENEIKKIRKWIDQDALN